MPFPQRSARGHLTAKPSIKGAHLPDLADISRLVNAYASGARDPATLLAIARHLVAAKAAVTSADGTQLTALRFLGEMFTSRPALKERHWRDYVEAIAVGPYVRGDGVTEADLRAALRDPAVRSRDLVSYIVDFIKDSDVGTALVQLGSGDTGSAAECLSARAIHDDTGPVRQHGAAGRVAGADLVFDQQRALEAQEHRPHTRILGTEEN
jgi:hypothetical protein